MDKGERLLERIKAQEAVNQADFFDVGILEFLDEVRDMCVQNSCGKYNKTWICPPASGTVEELTVACKSYSRGILLNSVTHLEDSFDWENMQEGGRKLLSFLNEAKGFAEEYGFEDYRIFGGGRCHGCEECSYPDAPCLYPEQVFTPIEACGIMVSSLAKDAGFKYINGQNTVTFFGMILYND